MSEIAIGMAAPEGVALTVLTHLKIDDAIARFVEKLTLGVGKDSCKISADHLYILI